MDPTTSQPQNLTTPELSQPHKHFLNKKFIVTFIILLLLGGSAYAGIWYWQKQQVAQEVVPTFTPRVDTMTGWKTYTNTQYGFEFKYPSDLLITEVNHKIGVPNTEVRIFDSESAKSNIYISIFKDPYETIQEDIKGRNYSNVEINGINYYRYEILAEEHFIRYEFEKNGQLYQIDLTVVVNPETDEPKLNQILSTFKFRAPADTSTLKTYTNSKYGYSVQYPNSWDIDTTSADKDFMVGGYSYTNDKPVAIISGNNPIGGWIWLRTPNFQWWWLNSGKQDALHDSRNLLLLQVEKPDPAITLDQFFNSYPNLPGTPTRLTINGKEAIRASEDKINDNYQTTMTLIKGDDALYIFYYYMPDLYNPIIQTLHLN